MERLRILHCLEQICSGGVEQRRLSLARGLDPARYEQRILCTRATGGLPPLLEQAGCRVHEIGVFAHILDPRPYAAALRVIRSFRPHIIHGAVYEGVAIAAATGRLGRVPIIIGEETSAPTTRRLGGHALFRGLTDLTHHMVGVSPAVVDYLVNTLRLPRERVTLITNGVAAPPVPPDSEVAQLRASLGIKPHHVVLGTVGRLQDGCKRITDLLVAFEKLHQTHPHLRLMIVGDGEDRAMLERTATQLGVKDHAIFVGYQALPSAYYRIMDIFVLASAYEAFGLVLAEAMFVGLPVVATRVGGIPTVVAEGETGLLVPPLNPAALAEAIASLVVNPELRRTMGQNGLARAASKFGAERYVAEVDSFYQRIVQERGP